MFAYTYRNDGALRQLNVAGSQSFSFTYTGGKRLTSRSDSTGQAPSTFTYTANGSPTSVGLLQSTTAPGFYENAITYNAEGGQLGLGFYPYTGSGYVAGSMPAFVYTSRGEIAQDANSYEYANGTRIQITPATATSINPKTASFAFNAFQGRTQSTQSRNTCMGCSNPTGIADSDWTYDYDNSGRQTGADFSPGPGSSTDATAAQPYTNTKQYDVENHLIQQAYPWQTYGKGAGPVEFQLGYRWGALGHPLQIGSTSFAGLGPQLPTDFQYDTLAWDGDDLLFTVNPAGQIDDVKVADFADYVPGAANPLTVWERVSGQILGCHNAGNAIGAQAPFSQFAPSMAPCLSNATAPWSFVPAHFTTPSVIPLLGRGGMLSIPKQDGFSDGFNTFQGVRTYDEQSGTWTTPDAYRGDVHDPMSQKPYTWNRNNPYQYSDPTGYVPQWDQKWEDQWDAAHGIIEREAGDKILSDTTVIAGARTRGDDEPGPRTGKGKKSGAPSPLSLFERDLMHALGLDGAVRKLPTGTVGIDQTEYTLYHTQIKNRAGLRGGDDAYISRQLHGPDDLWIRNPDGTYTNLGDVRQFYQPDKGKK